MDIMMRNLVTVLTAELRAMCVPNKQLYRTGNMKASIATLHIDESFVDIIIATPYASFTNERGKMAGWIEKTVSRTCRCFASNNNVEDFNIIGQITYGG